MAVGVFRGRASPGRGRPFWSASRNCWFHATPSASG